MQRLNIVILLFVVIHGSSLPIYANNSSYITLSNQIARNTELEVVANNVANSQTTGFEADKIIFQNIDKKQSRTRANSFVYSQGMYKSEDVGPLKVTNRNLDLAIGGEGYFKVLTERGERYTLNGAIFINNQGVLVTGQGFPYTNVDSQPIILPPDSREILITEGGIVYADNEEIDIIGIFGFNNKFSLIKEGNNLYYSQADGILLEEFMLIPGALRESNVNSAKAMAEMIELQRSAATTNSLMSDIADLERSAITKIAK